MVPPARGRSNSIRVFVIPPPAGGGSYPAVFPALTARSSVGGTGKYFLFRPARHGRLEHGAHGGTLKPVPAEHAPVTDDHPVDEAREEPTVTCSRCDRAWNLMYELDELQAGNRALEQFALDHHRHTGHYPDDVTPWVADCRQCPETEPYLAERPAERFARTHARHTGHTVAVRTPDGNSRLLDRD